MDLIYAVASPYPKARDCAGFQVRLQQGSATGEMGFNDRSLSALGSSLNPGRALASLATAAAVLGTYFMSFQTSIISFVLPPCRQLPFRLPLGTPSRFRAEMDAHAARIVVPENRVREVSRDEAESAHLSVRTVQ